MNSPLNTSAIVSLIADGKASPRERAELDRRVPVHGAEVDRRTLPCFNHCALSDDVEVLVGETWTAGKVVDIAEPEGKRYVRVDVAGRGMRFTSCHANEIRWPVSIDRKALPCFDACIVGDEVEALCINAPGWMLGTVRSRRVGSEGVVLDISFAKGSGVIMGEDSPERLRWPAPKAQTHEEWVKGLRPTATIDACICGMWMPALVKQTDEGDDFPVCIADDSAIDGERWIHKDYIRPLSTPATVTTRDLTLAEMNIAEGLKATIAAKDAEIARLLASFDVEVCRKWDTITAHEKTIADLRAAAGVRADRITQQDRVNEEQAKAIGDLRATIARLEGEKAAEKAAHLRHEGGTDHTTGRLEYAWMFRSIRDALGVSMVGVHKNINAAPPILAAIEALKAKASQQRCEAGNVIITSDVLETFCREALEAKAEITRLRASALVVPEEVLKRHPLPWTADGNAVRDPSKHVVSACMHDALASAIAKAATAGVGS